MEITSIKTDNLFHHPDNPRIDYGDIEELVDSIKENGIQQPLTVVKLGKHIERYNVVAGNRRLEAAKAAGLSEVPCIISELNDKEQASLMLIENMQRKNLTPYEEGRGVQMCLDLGMTEADLAKKTGFSKETIRHRKKLAELDQEKLKEKCTDGQISMQDLIALEKIKDIETRNEILEDIGTNNFGYRIANAISSEKAEEDRKQAYGTLTTFAEEMPADWYDNSYRQVGYGMTGKIEIPEDARNLDEYETTPYAFKLTWNGAKTYALYRIREDIDEGSEDPEESKYEVRRRKEEEACAKLRELAKLFYTMRRDYMLSNTEFHGNAIQWLVYLALQEDFSDEEEDRLNKPEGFDYGSMFGLEFRYELYAELMGDKEIADEYTAEDIVGDMKKAKAIDHPDAAAAIYCMLEVGPDHRLGSWHGAYDKDKDELNRLYTFMEQCGYELSDAERQILDGTHEAYYREDE